MKHLPADQRPREKLLARGAAALAALSSVGGAARAAMGPNDKFDLLVRNANVLDPSQNLSGKRDIGIRYGLIEAVEATIAPERANRVMEAGGKLVTPGLIDLRVRTGEPGAEWIRGTHAERADLRAAEIAVVMAGYIRALGWSARGHVANDTAGDGAGQTQVDLAALAQRAGVAKAVDGVLAMPFSRRGFRVAAVTTDYPLATDLHTAFNTTATRLNALGVADLCPGASALDRINASLR